MLMDLADITRHPPDGFKEGDLVLRMRYVNVDTSLIFEDHRVARMLSDAKERKAMERGKCLPFYNTRRPH